MDPLNLGLYRKYVCDKGIHRGSFGPKTCPPSQSRFLALAQRERMSNCQNYFTEIQLCNKDKDSNMGILVPSFLVKYCHVITDMLSDGGINLSSGG